MKNLSSFWKLVICIAFCELTGALSGILTMGEMTTWFDTINKPSWNPPSFIFGPVWGILYLMMGIALWLVWKSGLPVAIKNRAFNMFYVQLFFNFCWSILFFKLHSPLLALVDILLMVITISITIARFAAVSRSASWLMVPYLLWVCFATVLNFTIWSLNA